VPLSRRALLAASLAAAGPARSADPALRDGARRAGLWFGATPEVDPSAEPDYTALLTSNCDLLAPNLNWQRLSPTPSGPLVAVDGSVAVARAAGLKLTGYHLLWHQRLPVWFDALDRPQAERAIVAHIQTMAAAFGRDSLSWNVVNEAIMPGGLRPSPLTVKFGADFFDLAYRAALESAPNVLRLYNDYDLELATPSTSAAAPPYCACSIVCRGAASRCRPSACNAICAPAHSTASIPPYSAASCATWPAAASPF
jgi:endo-1,4-beta-xylanase